MISSATAGSYVTLDTRASPPGKYFNIVFVLYSFKKIMTLSHSYKLLTKIN